MIARAAPRVGLTIGSLFSGIGGLELGLERAGLGPVKWQVEIDPYCRAVLAKHWPDARRYEDVRVVGPELERVGIICGGFPCQDVSRSGPGLGLAGSRSGLWSEFFRIVGAARPEFVVVENVSTLASNGLDRVLGDLASIGFDAIWFPVAAADVGAPHYRGRLFVVAFAGADAGSLGLELARIRPEVRDLERMPEASTLRWEEYETFDQAALWWERESGLSRVGDGIPYGVERYHALGNAVVPACAEVVGWVVRGIHERLTR